MAAPALLPAGCAREETRLGTLPLYRCCGVGVEDDGSKEEEEEEAENGCGVVALRESMGAMRSMSSPSASHENGREAVCPPDAVARSSVASLRSPSGSTPRAMGILLNGERYGPRLLLLLLLLLRLRSLSTPALLSS